MQQWVMKDGVTDAAELVLQDVPIPEPGPGEVRIRVRAVSINGRDQLVLKGPFGRVPGQDLVPLSDVSGDIDGVGDGVDGWTRGDRVTNVHFLGWDDGAQPDGLGLGLGALTEQGVLAEYVILPSARVTAAASNLDAAEAATVPVAGVTAWNALNADHPVRSGQKVMIIGTGGVSLYALQLARAAGADVFAVVRQDDKGQRLIGQGARGFVNSTSVHAWGQALFDLANEGVDKAVDTVGAGTLNQSMAALAKSGEAALVGLFELDAQPLDAMLLISRTLHVRGIAVGSARMHRDLVAAIEAHDIHPVIYRRFPFAEAKEAFRAHMSGDVFGKVVIELPVPEPAQSDARAATAAADAADAADAAEQI